VPDDLELVVIPLSENPIGPKTAIIPAAGLGTRLLPATKAIPKELLPVGNVPAIQFILEECVRAGIKRMVVVVSDDKDALVRYLTPDGLLLTLRKDGPAPAHVRLEELLGSIEVVFVTQDQPRGLGHAVSRAEGAVTDGEIAVLLPDDLFPQEGSGIAALLSLERPGMKVGLIEVDPDDVSRWGIVDGRVVDDALLVETLVEKPDPMEAPSRLAVTGRYILPREIFAVLRETKPGRGGEIQLTDAIATLSEGGVPLWGVKIDGIRLDIGDRDGYLEAQRIWLQRERRRAAQPR